MPKYSIKVKNRFIEEMEVSLCDSFDQAASYLEKGVYRRELQLAKRFVVHGQEKKVPADLIQILKDSGDYPKEENEPKESNEPNNEDDAKQGNSPEMGERSGEKRGKATLRS